MNALKAIPVLLAMAVVSACETLTVPDFNNPSIEELTGADASEIAVITAAQGLFIRARNGIAGRAGYVSELGIIGRESYNFDAADPRFVTELLRDALDGGNGAFGGNHWTGRYRGFRDADNVLNAVDALATLDAADKEGLRGFTKTFQALDLLLVINTRDDLGGVSTVAEDPTGDPEPIVDRAAVFARIAALLDEAQTHLGAGTFPSTLRFPSGFTGFDTPATFLSFNRALKARVDVYVGNTALALSSSLPASFLDETGAFGLGVYYNYGTGSGDLVNNLFDPSNLIILAHPSIETDAQTQTDGVTLDQRFVDKTLSVAAVTDQATLGLSSSLAFNMYTSATAPVAIIRNEELILLRAEANLLEGNIGQAEDDLNILRNAAGLADVNLTPMTAAERIDELLYDRRYSLLFEGHRWIDVRRFDRLADLLLNPALRVHARFPFPQSECNARVPPPSQGCS